MKKINMLAKSKTRKGGLGKKWAPRWIDNLQRQFRQKQGAWKKTIPRWIENPKGRSRQKWDDEKWNKKNKHAKALTTDAMSKALTWLFQRAAIPFKLFYSFLPSTTVSTYLQTAASPEEELFANTRPSASHYVPNIPVFRLPLRNCVYTLPIIMHSRAFIHA